MCLLAQTKIAQNKQNNDDDTDKINDLVHGIPNPVSYTHLTLPTTPYV